MKYKNIIQRIIVITGLSYPAFGDAQQLPTPEVNAVVNEAARLVKVHYVSEKKGEAISRQLLMADQQGAFRSVANWDSLGILLTTMLKKFGNDGHLYVRNNPEIAKSLNRVTTDTLKAAKPEDVFFYGKKAEEKNYGFREVRILDNNIGYIRLSEINLSDRSLPLLTSAMRLVGNSHALIIDLRDNGGGGSDIGAVLESFFLPKDTPLLEVVSRAGTQELIKTVNWLLDPKYSKPVYILVNKKTASAAEAFAFVMQANKKAVVVGETTAGAANMNEWYPINEHLYISISLLSPRLPRTAKSWEETGVHPDLITLPGEELSACEEKLK